MQPAAYTRNTKNWQKWLGREGVVVVSSTLHTAPKGNEFLVPYDWVLVDFGDEKAEFMGVPGETFSTGDKIRCVLRKIAKKDKNSIIEYGIKVIGTTNANA